MQRSTSAPHARAFASYPIDFSTPSAPAPTAQPFGSILRRNSTRNTRAPTPPPPARAQKRSLSALRAAALATMPSHTSARKHKLVIKGLMGHRPDGVIYAPQEFIFAYNNINETQAKLVDEALSEAVVEWNAQPD
eukprot:3074638-Rhodomonas_salina.1